MKFRPLGARALIKLVDPAKVTAGGIIIPDTADPERGARQGIVIEVGPGALLETGERRPMPVKPSDTVMFGQYSGTAVTLDHEEFFVVAEDDIHGVIEQS